MQTNFTPEQLADPQFAHSESILRNCVHCGFCTATCPTYVELGDELDSPRGRIYLIKQMLEKGEAAQPEVVKHVDRCLSCLSCMSTCPSGVNYMHLVDEARVAELDRREVDRDDDAGVLPAHGVRAGLAQDLAAELVDQARLLREGDEAVGPTKPRVGWIQRTRASRLSVRPLSKPTLGW